jgi:hypothetical protein
MGHDAKPFPTVSAEAMSRRCVVPHAGKHSVNSHNDFSDHQDVLGREDPSAGSAPGAGGDPTTGGPTDGIPMGWV